MAGFTKLDSGIVDSTLWMHDHDVLRVWIAMLAKSDANGIVRVAVPNMAGLCRVTMERLHEILSILTSPDQYSRTKEQDGRRLLEIDGGWVVVNYPHYRDIHQGKPGSAAERQRRYRERKRFQEQAVSESVTRCNALQRDVTENNAELEAEAEAKEEEEQKRQHVSENEQDASKPKRNGRRGARLPDGWSPSQSVYEWARKDHPGVNLQSAIEEFSDYWRAVPGQKGLKLDWDATFRNRVREIAAKQARYPNAKGRGNGGSSAVERVERAIQERREAEERSSSSRGGG